MINVVFFVGGWLPPALASPVERLLYPRTGLYSPKAKSRERGTVIGGLRGTQAACQNAIATHRQREEKSQYGKKGFRVGKANTAKNRNPTRI